MTKLKKNFWNDIQLLYLKDKVYHFARIEKGIVNNLKIFKNLNQAKAELGLVDVKTWLRKRSQPLEYNDAMYEILHCREYWIVSPPIDATEKEHDADWWSGFNATCIKCSKKCKQSHYVSIIDCPQYTKTKGK